MAKITSREDTTALQLQELQDITIAYSAGQIGPAGAVPSAKYQVGQTLQELTYQVENLLKGRDMALNAMQLANDILSVTASVLSVRLEAVEDMFSQLADDVGYDSALDTAATCLVDDLVTSGVADATADGDMVFDTRVPLSKEDLKPYLRDAIAKWIEERLAK